MTEALGGLDSMVVIERVIAEFAQRHDPASLVERRMIRSGAEAGPADTRLEYGKPSTRVTSQRPSIERDNIPK